MSGGSTVFTSVAGYGLRRLARVFSEGFGNKGEISQGRHYRDPGLKTALNLNSFWMGPTLAQGVITDSTVLGHCYRVQLEKAHFPIICVSGAIGSYGASGVRDLSTLPPGTRVVVMLHPQTYYGVILATIPSGAIESKLQMHTLLNHATRNRVDEAHLQPYKQGGRGFAASWAAGRPFDSTSGGEKGFISETGIRLFVDSFMAQLAVDEACGVFAFYHDQLLRLAGYNLSMFSAGMQREGRDDQGEYNDWTGYTPFPWEQMGQFERTDPTQELKPEQWQIGTPWYGVWEPASDRQRPWHRELEFHGYLGQGGKRLVQTRPNTVPGQPPYAAEYLESRVEYPGLADDFTGLDGRRIIASAKGVSVIKRIFIGSPSLRYTAEQIKTEGDGPLNYKHASMQGDGPDHVIRGEIEPVSDPPELNRAMGVLDLHAYWFNYGTTHPFFYHAKDWNLVSEDRCGYTEGVTMIVPTYTELADSVFLKAPDPKVLKIDHRYGHVKYWQNECGLELLEDGGLSLFDGWGTELRMTAGSAWLSAPGDVWLNPGRNVNIWGGDDINMRAKHSIDIVTTWKDIRIKSQRNTHMLSGNGGLGGTLIECRAADMFKFDGCGEDVLSGGVFLRSEMGTVGAWATDIYLRTGGGNIPAGMIFLDSDKGASPLVTYSSALEHYIDSGVFWNFGCIEGICAGPTASVTPSGTTWPGFMCNPDDGVIFGGPAIFDGGVISTEGFAAVECPFVGCLDGDALSKIMEAIAICYGLIHTTLPQLATAFTKTVINPLFYDPDKPGNEDVIYDSRFSLRTTEQYGTKNFRMYEMRWQQMGRQAGTLYNNWTENAVECSTDPSTYPYPGKEAFQGACYYQQDSELFKIQGTNGRALNHGSRPELADKYKSPIYATSKPVGTGEYRVIRPADPGIPQSMGTVLI